MSQANWHNPHVSITRRDTLTLIGSFWLQLGLLSRAVAADGEETGSQVDRVSPQDENMAATGSPQSGGVSGRDVPWLAEVQKEPENVADLEPLPDLLVGASGEKISGAETWLKVREEIESWWMQFLGFIPPDREPPSWEVLAEDTADGVRRQLIRYESEPSWPVEAYILSPLEPSEKRPGVVVFHPTTAETIRQPAGLGADPSKAFGLQLARRGMVCVCPRCFLWTDGPQSRYLDLVNRFQLAHPQAKGMAKMLWDAMKAVDLLASLPDIDPRRLGAIGHSLGAKEVLYLAAFDPRVKAAVSSEGGIGLKFSNWEAPWYLGPSIRATNFSHEHHELLALVAPRAFLLIGGDSADGRKSWPFIAAALPIYYFFGKPARIGLFNHGKGHSVPPEALARSIEWLETYL